MLKEFIETIVELGQKSLKASVIVPTAEPDYHYLLSLPSGKVETREATPQPRDHKAGSIEALTAFVTAQAEDAVDAVGAVPPCVVWYSRQAVTAILDDSTRRDRVTLPIRSHPMIGTLTKLETDRTLYDQRGLVRLLRIDLGGTAPDSLIDVIRRVKFRQGNQGESVVQHGKASLGRQIEAELTGAGTIPESTSLVVPVFQGALSYHRECIECAIEIVAETEKFQLIPLPGAIEKAIVQAEIWLGNQIGEMIGDAARVYFGQP